jgi:hypothetical protein
MSTHSPGPWSYHGRTECIRDVEGNRIADLSMSRHHGDGHLFAAAPDLLEAVELMVSQYGCACGQRGCNRCEYSQIAREAIRKARGER